MKIKYLYLAVILFVTGLSLLSTYIIRQKVTNNLISDEGYYHIFLADTLKSQKDLSVLLFEGSEYSLADFFLLSFKNPYPVVKYLPVLLGIFSIAIFFCILIKIGLSPEQSLITSLILAISPSFIYAFTVFENSGIIGFLGLLAILFLLYDFYLPALFIVCIIPIIDLQALVISIIIIMSFYHAVKKRKLFPSIVLIAITGGVYSYYLKPEILALKENFVALLISDLGAKNGIGIFSVALSLLGIFIIWREKREEFLFYILILCLLLVSALIPNFIIFLDIMLVYYAGIGINKLLHRQWEYPTLKSYVILLIACGLFLSATTQIVKLAGYRPSETEKNSLEWLFEYSNSSYNKSSVVLSSYENGIIIKSIARMDVVSDNYYFRKSSEKSKIKDSEEMFYSRDLAKTKALLDKYNVKYIWINKDMMQNVWQNEEQGLLFLVENSKAFKKIYEDKDVFIWEYLNE
ncbi:MAG: hypothetical protein V1859_08525 [archaeon]